jgi:signal transduction histidine kinase
MKDLSTFVSPISWGFIALFGITQYVFLLGPSFKEMFIFLVVDTIAFGLLNKFDTRLFTRFFPDARPYLPRLDNSLVSGLDLESRLKLFNSLSRFPLRRAIYAFLTSFIKVIPVILLVVFYWEHEISALHQFLIFVGTLCVTMSYFYGAVFIESHFYVSDLITELHKKYNWKEVFKNAEVDKIKNEFQIQEWVAVGTLTVSLLLLQWTVVTSHTGSAQLLAAKIIFVAATAIVSIGHLFYLSRTFLLGGLNNLFQTMDKLDYSATESVLPLHSTEILARFEKSFNLLIDRLRASEQEIASWIFTEAEKTRYRTLGEMSALIAHDMTGPLHVVKFCIEQIKEEPEKSKDTRYMLHLAENLNRVLDLIDSLRARLKDSNKNQGGVSVQEAHSHVVRLLETQYSSSKEFNRIKFEVDPDLQNLHLPMSRVDLIHIIDNIYRNSIENMMAQNSTDSRIQIKITGTRSNSQLLAISDTGTGLSAEDFDKLTAFEFLQKKSKAGLGLKLTRRLVELNGGKLSVASEPIEGFSTTFAMELPLAQSLQTAGA